MRELAKQNVDILNSWKEIASYLGRGVRTVQRWESELHLPVHRMGQSDRSPVFAFKPELDNWVRRQAGPQWQAAHLPSETALESGKQADAHAAAVARAGMLTGKMLSLLAKQQLEARILLERVRKMKHVLPARNRTRLQNGDGAHTQTARSVTQRRTPQKGGGLNVTAAAVTSQG